LDLARAQRGLFRRCSPQGAQNGPPPPCSCCPSCGYSFCPPNPAQIHDLGEDALHLLGVSVTVQMSDPAAELVLSYARVSEHRVQW
jgi:hypothetical protein